MPEWVAILVAAGSVIVVQLLVAAFIYGQLTRDVKGNTEATKAQGLRLGNVETVLSGPGGHGERLTALEAWRIEHRAQQK